MRHRETPITNSIQGICVDVVSWWASGVISQHLKWLKRLWRWPYVLWRRRAAVTANHVSWYSRKSVYRKYLKWNVWCNDNGRLDNNFGRNRPCDSISASALMLLSKWGVSSISGTNGSSIVIWAAAPEILRGIAWILTLSDGSWPSGNYNEPLPEENRSKSIVVAKE